jgi:HEAT repeat protein
LLDTPPWQWPSAAGKLFRKILVDRRANASDRLIAAELAGDLIVMNDDLAACLLAVAGNASEPESLRAKAAISLGPVLEQAAIFEFEDPSDVPITERTFHNIQDSLKTLYLDNGTPKEVRRRILEASVRSPEAWHQDAIRHAYSSGDREWILTAVFSMARVRGFDGQILEALKSDDPEIHYEAVEAAGNWDLDAAWPHIVKLVKDPDTPKPLRLVAIGAVGSIRPAEARGILEHLTGSYDVEIAEAAGEALAMAEGASGEDEDGKDEDDEKEWIN